MYSTPSNIFQFAPSDRQLPYSTEAEEAILGGLLIDPAAIYRVPPRLTIDSFYHLAHQHIFRAILALTQDGICADLITVSNWLSDRKTDIPGASNLLEFVGNTSKLATLVDQTVSASTIDLYAELVIEKYQRRQLHQVGNAIANLGLECHKSLEEVMTAAEKQLQGITHQNLQSLNRLKSASDVAEEIFKDLEEGGQVGISTGIYDLDDLTAGLKPGMLIVAAGRAGMGKTHYATWMSYVVAALHQLPVVFFSCEMGTKQIGTRFLSLITAHKLHEPIESNRIENRQLRTEEWVTLAKATKTLSEMPLYIFDEANPSMIEMRGILQRVEATHGKIGLIVLDYAQLLGEGDEKNRVRELDRLILEFKRFAKDFNAPFLCLAQISRSVESRQNKRPTMADLRESGAFEMHANEIHLLYRDEYYNENTFDKGVLEIDLAKNRHGPSGTVKVTIDMAYSHIKNIKKPGRYD